MIADEKITSLKRNNIKDGVSIIRPCKSGINLGTVQCVNPTRSAEIPMANPTLNPTRSEEYSLDEHSRN